MFIKQIKRRQKQSIPDELRQWPEHIAQIYADRGVLQAGELNKELSQLDDYRLLGQNETAAKVLADIIQQQKKLCIIGDFDADGATSSVLLILALKAMGLNQIDYLVPNRFEYGYGLTEAIVNIAATKQPDWLITVDNGISSLSGVALAKQLGIGVIITDHHLPPEELPDADVIVNPNVPGDHFPSKNLAGVGVAFYVLIALRAELRKRNYFKQHHIPEPNLSQWLDLVALGTVADVVPLDTNNRRLVHHGLERIKKGLCRPGLLSLLKNAKRDYRFIEASDLAFSVGPRLNAAGRLEDMSVGIECLLAESESTALSYVLELDSLNQQRREIEADMLTQALNHCHSFLEDIETDKQTLPASFCLYEDSWHQGVVGLIASRIKEKFNRPVIAFAQENDQQLKGSGRSIPGIHIRDVLANIAVKHPQILEKFGGHAMAAGLSLKKEDLTVFEKLWQEEVDVFLSRNTIDNRIITDGEIDNHQWSLDFISSIQQAGPWGQAFPEPCFHGTFLVNAKRILKDKHLKLTLCSLDNSTFIDAIYFNVEPSLLEAELQKIQVVYKLSINRYQSMESVQMMIEHLLIVN